MLVVQAATFVLALGTAVVVLIGGAGLAVDLAANQVEFACAVAAVGLSAIHLLRTSYGEQS